jgi:acyl-CoA thioesterase YciA
VRSRAKRSRLGVKSVYINRGREMEDTKGPDSKNEHQSVKIENSPDPQDGAGRYAAIRTVMMPRDTNALGSIFGGHILSLIDLAAGQHARTISPKRYVTKVMREVNFLAPVYVGDSVSFYTSSIKVGRTSVLVRVEVEAQRGVNCIDTILVTSAEVVMVAVDDMNNPIPIF